MIVSYIINSKGKNGELMMNANEKEIQYKLDRIMEIQIQLLETQNKMLKSQNQLEENQVALEGKLKQLEDKQDGFTKGQDDIVSFVKAILEKQEETNGTLNTHGEQLLVIKNQTAKNTEMQALLNETSEIAKSASFDIELIKKFLRN